MTEEAQVEREGTVVPRRHDLLHEVGEARLAIGRQPHHLVLVAIVREADELRHRLVEHAQRMREVDAAVDRQPAALTQPPGGRGKVAETVDRYGDGLVVGRDQEGRGKMAEMMLDTMDGAGKRLVGQALAQVARDVGALAALAQAGQHVARADARRQHIGELAPAIGAVVAVHRDMLDVGQADAGLVQAIADRLAREAAPVLDAPEAFFLDGGDQRAVLDQAGRGVGVVGVQSEDPGHLSRSRRSRCMDRMRSAVIRWAV